MQETSPHIFYHGVRRLLICGSRTTTRVYLPQIRAELSHLNGSVRVCHGGNGYFEREICVRGADMLADEICREMGLQITLYPAKFSLLGPVGGPIRNAYMLKDFDPDAILAFRMPGDSPGTDGMLRLGRGARKPCRIVGL